MTQRANINLNNRVYVQLTDAGRAWVSQKLQDLFAILPYDEVRRSELAKECAVTYDRGEMPLHQFMAMFGAAFEGFGPREPLFESGMNIQAEVEVAPPWHVYYSNYFPREIDSTWPTEQQAKARADELNAEGGDWRIEQV